MKYFKTKRRKNPSHISISQCKENHIYVGWGRQFNVGIFKNEEYPYFIGYNIHEYHWDIGAPGGTFKPIYDLGKAPNFNTKKERSDYLKELSKSKEVKNILQNFQLELDKEIEIKRKEQTKIEKDFGPYLYYCKYCEYVSENFTAKCPQCKTFGTERILYLREKDGKLYETKSSSK